MRLRCDTTDVEHGPEFESQEARDAFLVFLGADDPRTWDDGNLDAEYQIFKATADENERLAGLPEQDDYVTLSEEAE